MIKFTYTIDYNEALREKKRQLYAVQPAPKNTKSKK